MRTAAHEAADPKYSATERERRFLVDPALRPVLDGLPYVLIEDRYLIGTRMRLRRMTDSLTGEIALKFAKKYDCPDPLARPMVNAYLDEEEYAALATLPANPLSKRRYQIGVDDALFGVDIFLGPLHGLELAEVDGPDDRTLRAVRPPSWVIREVSDDPFFQGGSLAALDALALRDRLALV